LRVQMYDKFILMQKIIEQIFLKTNLITSDVIFALIIHYLF